MAGMEMTPDAMGGLPTFHSRVDNWECDFNGHWNTRFYTRAFQLASELVASLEDGVNPGAAAIRSRHMRFHSELFPGDPVEIRSAALSGGDYDGAVVHLLLSGGKLSATALDRPGRGAEHLPVLSAQSLPFALPRGLDGVSSHGRDSGEGAILIETGAIRPAELDHTGALLFDEIIRRCAFGSHALVVGLGYSPAFTERTGIGRMLAEMHVELLGRADQGSALQVTSRLTAAGGKSFRTTHHLHARDGRSIAFIDLCTLAVDMKSRRATDVPDFLLANVQPS
ncbi:MAG: thioesterase family protein [Sphingobium sp.]